MCFTSFLYSPSISLLLLYFLFFNPFIFIFHHSRIFSCLLPYFYTLLVIFYLWFIVFFIQSFFYLSFLIELLNSHLTYFCAFPIFLLPLFLTFHISSFLLYLSSSFLNLILYFFSSFLYFILKLFHLFISTFTFLFLPLPRFISPLFTFPSLSSPH